MAGISQINVTYTTVLFFVHSHLTSTRKSCRTFYLRSYFGRNNMNLMKMRIIPLFSEQILVDQIKQRPITMYSIAISKEWKRRTQTHSENMCDLFDSFSLSLFPPLFHFSIYYFNNLTCKYHSLCRQSTYKLDVFCSLINW